MGEREGRREGRWRGVDVMEGSGCGGEGGEGGGRSTIPSALVGSEHVSAHGLWREDMMCHLYL